MITVITDPEKDKFDFILRKSSCRVSDSGADWLVELQFFEKL